MWRVAWRVLAALLALAVALVATVIIVLHTDWGREQVRKRVEAQLGGTVNGTLSIGKLEGSVLGEFTLVDVTIRDAEGRVAVYAPDVDIDYNPWALLWDRFDASSVALPGVKITAATLPNGDCNVLTLLDGKPGEPGAPPSEPSPWRVIIDALSITAGAVTVECEDLALATFSGVDVTSSLTAGAGDVTFTMSSLRANWDEQDVPLSASVVISDVEGGWLFSDGTVSGADIVATAPTIRMGTGGAIEGLVDVAAGARTLSLEQPVHLPAATLDAELERSAYGRPLIVRGRGAAGAVRGDIAASIDTLIAVSAELQLADLDVSRWTATSPPTALSGHAAILLAGADVSAARGIVATDLTGEIAGAPAERVAAVVSVAELAGAFVGLAYGPGGELSGSGTLAVIDGRVVVSDGAAEGHAEVAEWTGPDLAAAGTVTFDLVANGPLDDLEVAGAVGGTKLRVDATRVSSVSGRVDLAGVPDRLQGDVVAYASGIRSGARRVAPMRITARRQSPGGPIAMTVRSRSGSGMAIAANADVVPGERGAEVAVTWFELARRGVAWRGSASGAVTYAGDVTVRRAVARSGDGTLVASGTVTAGEILDVSGRVRGTAVELGEVATLLGGDTVARGSSSFVASVTMRGDDLTATIEGDARGVSLGTATTGFDADYDVDLRYGRLALDVRGSGAGVGSAEIGATIIAPRDVTDAVAWRGLRRRSVLSADVTVANIDVARACRALDCGGSPGGIIERATANMSRTGEGSISITGSGIPAPWGDEELDGTATASFDSAGLAHVEADTRGRISGTITAAADIALPSVPFSRTAWEAAGRSSIRGGTIRVRDARPNAALLARIDHRIRSVTGLDLDVTVDPGATTTDIAMSVEGVASDIVDDTLEVTLDVAIAGPDATGTASVTGARAGTGRVNGTVSVPSDLLDAVAWRGADQSWVRALTVELESARIERRWLVDAGVDHLFAASAVNGTVDIGDSAQEIGGELRARAVRTRAWRGPAAVTASFTGAAAGDISIVATLTTPKDGTASIDAVARAPQRLDDRQAWRALDESALRRAKVTARSLSVSPESLARFGLEGYEVTGLVDVDAIVADRAKKTVITATAAALRVPSVKRPTRVAVEATVRDDRIDVDASATFAERDVSGASLHLGAGRLALRANGFGALRTAPATGDFIVDGMPARVVFGLLGRRPSLTGSIDASGEMAGTFDAPTGSAIVSVDDAEVRRVGFTSLTGEIAYDGETLTAGVDGTQVAGGTASASARVARSDAGALVADMKAKDFDVAVLSALDPSFAFSGLVSGSATARGTRDAPIVEGALALVDGRIDLGGPIPVVKNVSASLAIAKSVAKIEVDGKAGGGALGLRARSKLDGLLPQTVSGTMTADTLPINTGSGVSYLTIDAAIRGRRGAGGWDATVSAKQGTFVLPSGKSRRLHTTSRPADVVFVEETVARASGAAEAPALRSIALIIDELSVRGAGVNAELRVGVSRTYGDGAAMTGGAETLRGTVELFGRKYEIRRAVATFDGASETDPFIDVRVAHEFGAFTLFVDVRGRLSQPSVTLSADPPLYGEEQLIAIVLGATPGEEDSDRPLVTGAAGIAAGVVSGRLQSLVADVLPVDVVRVDSGDDPLAAESITVGKWLTEKLFVAYRHRFDAAPGENSGEATFEWRFWRRWMIEGFFGDRSAGGADLVWIMRY